ncbi:type II secretion system F family protein [Proteiniclasticum sp. SCR006]|uniref:Type II secretion system F family protein n=1 Tax=Proteiniclasticum aestuarii TaxID=2817862 RepID=A0A939HEA6_9CLOT|nr:type II secretion system F family protein [Proteiniclasticum aestuarii]MBO1265970.1 type II secretion system F family protein [Proteiniclasticum aestuarii]
MELMVYVLLFITASLFFGIVFQMVFGKRLLVSERMEEINSMYSLQGDEDEMRKPFVERVVNPAYQRFVEALGSITPGSIKKKYEQMIMQAGVGKKFTPSSILSIQVMLAIVMGSLLYLVFRLLIGEGNILLSVLFGALGFFLPYVRLNSTAQIRQKKVQSALPDLLDLLYISVEAGLGFDTALKKSADKMPGPLSDEIKKALEDIAKGRDRQEALKGIIRRTGVDDINTFITAVIQSEILGTNIATMLRTQSTVMRQKRRQRAEEAAMKIPIKMLFPLIFFMFPALFVVILGPAVISVIENMSGLF